MGPLEQPVEDGVGDRRVAKTLVPVADWQLRGGDHRAPATILDDFKKVGGLVVRVRAKEQIVKDEDVDAREVRHHLCQASVSARDAEIIKEPRHAHVECGRSVANGVVRNGAGEKGLADARRANDHHLVVIAHPG